MWSLWRSFGTSRKCSMESSWSLHGVSMDSPWSLCRVYIDSTESSWTPWKPVGECKVLLTHNLWTSKGLVNGAQGVVKKIWFHQGSNAHSHLPAVVFVQFDEYSGP